MKTQTFTASITQEDKWFIAQCLEVDVSSQGKSEGEAINNLREALELYFEPPRPTVMPKIRKFEVNIGSNEATSLSAD
ncbi:MAG: type II toxin-antitoxin system HicB family antitoxin [Candidatus Poribacteria bacterium]|nr:type II toxin-antitoxin system HicB family antitoxin [Candidatus Poribacteria bacterium]